MSRLTRVRAKVKRDEALNLTELALVTDYDRNTLGAMLLPLQGGKIFYTDFRRIISARQDRHEDSLRVLVPVKTAAAPGSESAASAAATPPMKSVADKFHAPKNPSARRGASRARVESRPHNTELQRRRA